MLHPFDVSVKPPSRRLRIDPLAAQSGFTIRDLNFYTDAEVVGALSRSAEGFRLFPPEALHGVEILRAAQAAGFSPVAIRDLLKTLRQDKVPCGHACEAPGMSRH